MHIRSVSFQMLRSNLVVTLNHCLLLHTHKQLAEEEVSVVAMTLTTRSGGHGAGWDRFRRPLPCRTRPTPPVDAPMPEASPRPPHAACCCVRDALRRAASTSLYARCHVGDASRCLSLASRPLPCRRCLLPSAAVLETPRAALPRPHAARQRPCVGAVTCRLAYLTPPPVALTSMQMREEESEIRRKGKKIGKKRKNELFNF
jgi:hypothetical protein